MPYDSKIYAYFKSLNIPFIVVTPGTTDTSTSHSVHTGILHTNEDTSVTPAPVDDTQDTDINRKSQHPKMEWTGKSFRLQMKYNADDVKFVKSLKGAYWHKTYSVWVIRANVPNLKKLQRQFTLFDAAQYAKVYGNVALLHDPKLVTLYQTPQYPHHAMVEIRGYTCDVSIVKSIASRSYDKVYKRWMIPNDAKIIQNLIERYIKIDHKVINRLAWAAKPVSRTESKGKFRSDMVSKCPPDKKKFCGEYIDTMIRLGYKYNSIKAYTGKILSVITHFGKSDMHDISADMVNKYLEQIAKDDKQNSSLNVVHSAVQIYAKHMVFDADFQMERLTRPRKTKYLPAILSMQEVDRILSNIDNLKHTTIFYTMYGAGMRIGEVLSLQLSDIHWDRNQILVRGKGEKDRMVMLSEVKKKLLEKYFAEYKPSVLLFEGIKEGRMYSQSSVRAVLRRAVVKSQITRRVTPHILRHSFATHLMDKGVDSRFIQELLGHKDIKTTLQYLHVTNRQISTIKSPLDDLNLDKDEKV